MDKRLTVTDRVEAIKLAEYIDGNVSARDGYCYEADPVSSTVDRGSERA